MRKKRFPIYYMKFHDHCLMTPQEARPLACEVFGVLAKQDSKAYYMVPWICNSDLNDQNNEVYVILKSTVIAKKRIA